jgi:hypothetical protein
MPYKSEHAVRLNNPGKYSKFRRVNNKFGKGIDVIFGITKTAKGEKKGKSEIQAIRFDAGKFDLNDVKEWVKKHEYKPIKIEKSSLKESSEFNKLYNQLINE